MRTLDAHRRVVFALALAAIFAGATAISLFPHSGPRVRPPRPPRKATSSHDAAVAQNALSAASFSATRFTAGYVRYEEGVFGPAVRRSIRQFSTPELGDQLLQAPVRVPPGVQPPRQWVARVATMRVDLFEGRPALVAAVVILATDGGHLLRATLVEEDSRWLVAAIGP